MNLSDGLKGHKYRIEYLLEELKGGMSEYEFDECFSCSNGDRIFFPAGEGAFLLPFGGYQQEMLFLTQLLIGEGYVEAKKVDGVIYYKTVNLEGHSR